MPAIALREAWPTEHPHHAFVHAFSLTLLAVAGVTLFASAAVASLLWSLPDAATASDGLAAEA